MDKYSELNKRLNEFFVYLDDKYSLFSNHLRSLALLNDDMCKYLNKYSLSFEKQENDLTFEDIYMLGREILESIDPKYLTDYDNLIKSGELDFGYESEYKDSEFSRNYIKNTKYINLRREFNYQDVPNLIHEYVHYINAKDKFTLNRHLLTEFLPIYFEMYATDYLVDKGIDLNEIYYKKRLLHTRGIVNRLYKLESPLLAYRYFGDLSNETYKLLNKNVMKINKSTFDSECDNLLKYLKCDDINKAGYDIAYDYRYLIGTALAFYARKNCTLQDILWLNDNINDELDDVTGLLEKINIDVKDSTFKDSVKESIYEYLQKYNVKKR